jgi:hypothetical protein
MSDDDVCSICLDDMREDVIVLPECKHRFHGGCALKYFRCEGSFGRCPLCQQQPKYNLVPTNVEERVILLKRAARKKNAPDILKRYVSKLKQLENKQKLVKKELREFNKANKHVYHQKKKLCARKWNAYSQIRSKMRLLALLPIPTILLKSSGQQNTR